jgi:hypothetical protein
LRQLTERHSAHSFLAAFFLFQQCLFNSPGEGGGEGGRKQFVFDSADDILVL